MQQQNLGSIRQKLNYTVSLSEQTQTNAKTSSAGMTIQNPADILKSLRVGQTFSGQIIDIRGNMIQISLNNQVIQAQLADAFSFHIGQDASFLVKENNGQQLVLKPTDIMLGNDAEIIMQKALEAAGFPATEKNIELVKNLMLQQEPIDKQTLLQYMKSMLQFPDVNIHTLITLQKNNIPITAENIQNIENYQNYQSGFTEEIQNLSKELTSFAGELAGKEGQQKADNFLSQLWDIFDLPKGEEQLQKTDKLLKEQTENAIKNPLSAEEQKELIKLTGQEKNMDIVSLIQDKEASPEKILASLKNLIDTKNLNSEDITKLIQSDGFQRLLEKTIERQMLLRPEDLKEEGAVKEYYKKTAERAEKLERVLQEFGAKESNPAKILTHMNENIKMMNAVNEFMNYVQIPLKLLQQNTKGDLYVYTKKKGIRKAGEELTAMLHLDMEYLGSVDVFVKMKEKKVSTNFVLETEELLDFIEKHMDKLNRRLEEKGYSISSTVTKKEGKTEEETKIVQEIHSLEEEITGEWNKKRFSFDMRI